MIDICPSSVRPSVRQQFLQTRYPRPMAYLKIISQKCSLGSKAYKDALKKKKISLRNNEKPTRNNEKPSRSNEEPTCNNEKPIRYTEKPTRMN